MGDPVKDAWNEVAEGFSNLGKAMKDQYRSPAQEARTDAAGGPLGGAADAADGLREALERLIAAGRDIGQRTTDAVRDAEVNAQARQAVSSLNDALSATVDMIGREVSGLFARPDPPADEPAVVDTADEPPAVPPGPPPVG